MQHNGIVSCYLQGNFNRQVHFTHSSSFVTVVCQCHKLFVVLKFRLYVRRRFPKISIMVRIDQIVKQHKSSISTNAEDRYTELEFCAPIPKFLVVFPYTATLNSECGFKLVIALLLLSLDTRDFRIVHLNPQSTCIYICVCVNLYAYIQILLACLILHILYISCERSQMMYLGL